MRHFILSFVLFFGIVSIAQAQREDVLAQYFTTLATEEELDNGALEQLTEQLTFAAQHPKNLNTATREDFEALPFLDDTQVEKLCEYIYRYGPVRSIGELAMIPALEWHTRELLSLFFTIAEPTTKDSLAIGQTLRYGRHDLVLTGRVPFYTRRGDEQGYLGQRYAHSLRYTFNSGKVQAGLVGANDAGEPFFSHGNSWGYDHYALYAQVKDWGRLKHAVVGHYRIRLGQGLVFNSNFSLGKLAQPNYATRTTMAISPHASRMQSNYLQGAAATVTLSKHLELTAFASYRGIDATLTKDSTAAQTLLTTGYHRTPLEMYKKNNVDETIVGGHITYTNNKGLVFGLSAVYDRLSLPLRPNKNQGYRRYYAEGNAFSNYSVDYGYRSYRLSVAGETAIDKDGNLATLNFLTWRPLSDLRINLIQRFYGYKYNALHGESFSDGGSVKNESGIYLGAQWKLSRRWALMAYTDFAYFAWDKYQADGPSKSWDNLVQATYSLRGVTLLARYRFKTRQMNVKEQSALWWRQEHRGRLAATYRLKAIDMKTQLDVSHYQLVKRSTGWMLSQQGSTTVAQWLTLSATMAYFHTHDYYSRLYLYERQPLYSISFPEYHGIGIRYSVFARAAVGSHITLTASLGTTNYFNRNPISSGYQQINRSSKTDLLLQLRWKF